MMFSGASEYLRKARTRERHGLEILEIVPVNEYDGS